MSLKTWKKEFYKVEPSEEMSEIDSTEHSLSKWMGFLPENLNKHNCYIMDGEIHDNNSNGEKELQMNIGDRNCSLCVKYRSGKTGCRTCPLYKSLGKPCFDGINSPWRIWLNKEYNPKPMIEALEKTLQLVTNK